ncbi:hypothetical protein PybrP1_009105 [[Pythium] brassicae (nom. inval.)]|nr:hypothetical protein PybrP1_009105 [[Pythium] brassicae (nom. inval.)]
MATASLVVATRVHWSTHRLLPHEQLDVDAELRPLLAFCARAASFAAGALVAVGVPPAASDAPDSPLAKSAFEVVARLRLETASTGARVVVLPLLQWGRFVPALNALVAAAATHFPSARLLLLQSLEVVADAAAVTFLASRFEVGRDLVVGAALPGHDFRPSHGESESESGDTLQLDGRTTPWNTLALWDLARLALVGFPLLGDALTLDAASAGVEEVSTIALYQQLFPDASAAKLCAVPGIEWRVDGFDSDERRSWQERKMASKLQRAETQIAHFGLAKRGTVRHVR